MFQYKDGFCLTAVLFLSWILIPRKTIFIRCHYNDVIMGTMASQIASLTIVYSTVYPGADQRKQQSSASLAFVWGIHRLPVNSPHKGPVTRKMFPLDDVIMCPGHLTFTLLGIHSGTCASRALLVTVRMWPPRELWRLFGASHRAHTGLPALSTGGGYTKLMLTGHDRKPIRKTFHLKHFFSFFPYQTIQKRWNWNT